MKLRHVFAINVLFAFLFGTSCSLLPRWVFSLYGVTPDVPALWVTRLVGGSILGFATLMWFGVKVASVDARRAIASALLVQDTVGFIASLHFQFTYDVNLFGWFSLALYGILAIAYVVFLFITPERC